MAKRVPSLVIETLHELNKKKLRITYATLAYLCRGEVKMAGRMGAKLCKQLPPQFQPMICRKKGDYHKAAVLAWADYYSGTTAERERSAREWEAVMKTRPILGQEDAVKKMKTIFLSRF